MVLPAPEGPTKAIGLAKRAINRGLSMDLDQLLDYEVYTQEIAGGSEDHREGLKS